ncbi:MAG TPA: ribosome biogenesis GTPase Der [Clostridiales bacterium]|nr:ribosome biogenesis GTPase Der [Clostridiales bacterium]
MKPTVAIVGKSNTGKSTFFNRISGRRISIVQDIPGVTRDRILSEADWAGNNFNLIDTGGLEPTSEDKMQRHIKKQAELAIATSDVIIFFTDVKQGLTASDYEIADLLRTIGKPVILAVNKLDVYDPELLYDFYSLGFADVFGISAEQGLGLGDLLDKIVSFFPKIEAEEEYKDYIKIAVVGKPNTGKSSLINSILGEERVIVSDIPGTTRDSIDTPVTINGVNYVIIDTAGLRRKRSVDCPVEAISAIQSIKAIERADIALIMIDSSETSITEQDIRIAGYVHDEGKPSIIVMNKWDLVEKDTYTIDKYKKELDEKLKFMSYYRAIFLSAKTGKRLNKLTEMIKEVYENNRRRVSTGILNEIISNAVATTPPPTSSGRQLKIYYATQTKTAPPTFVLFVNDYKLMHFSYERYLENCLRSALDFSGTPISIQLKNKAKGD